MVDKDPLTYSNATYLLVIGLSLWGGIVAFYDKLQTHQIKSSKLSVFLGDMLTSALAGLCTFYLCEYYEVPKLVSAVLISMSGHMGSRFIFLMKRKIEGKVFTKDELE